MLQHTSSEVVIFRLQINLNSKNTTHCTDWELTKVIDIKRQEYANNRDKVSHCQGFHLRLALDHGSTETLQFYYACLIDQLLIFQNDPT